MATLPPAGVPPVLLPLLAPQSMPPPQLGTTAFKCCHSNCCRTVGTDAALSAVAAAPPMRRHTRLSGRTLLGSATVPFVPWLCDPNTTSAATAAATPTHLLLLLPMTVTKLSWATTRPAPSSSPLRQPTHFLPCQVTHSTPGTFTPIRTAPPTAPTNNS